MPEISSIEPQKSNLKKSSKTEKRFNVYVDGKFSFGISEENLINFKLKVGDQLTAELTGEILEKENEKKLIDQAINFLSYRPRSQREVEEFLVKKISLKEKVKYHQAKESPLIVPVVTKLSKYGYINDLDFARWWIESRNRARQKGKRVIKMELKQKGIDETIIDEILKSGENELELALKVLEKKKTKLATLVELAAKQKAYYYLASRGFEPNIIKEAFAIFFKKS